MEILKVLSNLYFRLQAPAAPPKLTYPTRAGGREFRPDPDRLLLSARGLDARRHIEGWLAREGIAAAPWSTRRSPHQISAIVQLPQSPTPRRAALIALRELIEKYLPDQQLSGQLAAPMSFGDQGAQIEGLTRQLVVRFAPHVTNEDIAGIAKRHGLTVVRDIPYAGNCRVLAAAPVPSYDLLETIEQLTADPVVEYVEPDVVTIAAKDGPDPLVPQQRDLQLIGCPGAWARMPAGARGGSPAITVAVIDLEGVDPAHPDLTGTLGDLTPKQIANHDFVNHQAQLPGDVLGSHGTHCAGAAVGRSDNAIGIAGVAGDCHLIGARISDTASSLEVADVWIWAAGLPTGSVDPRFPALPSRGADVILNAWGSPGELSQVQRDAIDYITTLGRGGRGAVMCFSAGNQGDEDFALARPAAAHPATIAVGASVNAAPTPPARVDTHPAYSPWGELDLVAPSSTTVPTVEGLQAQDPPVAAALSGFGDASSTIATTLTDDARQGAVSITVGDATRFEVGQRIWIGELPVTVTAAPREPAWIAAKILGGTLSLRAPLQRAHASGAPVSIGDHAYDVEATAGAAGGTSHATALVAGAAALVLSARPDLTAADVREILRRSAKRIDPAQSDRHGKWVDRDGDGVAEFSEWYGYGRLDVDAAVKLALTYKAPSQPSPLRGLLLAAGFGAAALGILGLTGNAGGAVGAARTIDWRPRQSCDLPRRAWSDACPIDDCGSNGPILSGFFIDGLNFDGCKNSDGVRVVPGPVDFGLACTAATQLDLLGSALVGRDAEGAVVCSGAQLDGTQFTVDGPARALRLGTDSQIQSLQLRVGVAGTVATLPAPGRASAPGVATTPSSTSVPSYTFEADGAPELSTCKPASAWMEDFTIDAPSSASSSASAPTGPTPAMLVAGELYDNREARVRLSGAPAQRWISVACRGSALSKLRQLGFDPTAATSTLATSTPDERQATLKMITARYCGAHSYTTDGVRLRWHFWKNTTAALPSSDVPIEARWSKDGALCIEHSRAWRTGLLSPMFLGGRWFSSEPELIEHVRETCATGSIFELRPLPLCSSPPLSDEPAYWTTYPFDHITD